MRRISIIGITILGALVITVLGIDAADSLRGSEATLLGGLRKGASPLCPEGMVLVDTADARLCVDTFEARPSAACTYQTIQNPLETERNLAIPECIARSDSEGLPWTYVTYHQAETLCAKSGKRLLSSEEWFKAAQGSPDTKDACAIEREGALSGAGCSNAYGIHHMVGNVWEWISESAIDGTIHNEPLPSSGYITEVTVRGTPSQSSATKPSTPFGLDYVWSEHEGNYGVLRGGFYGSGDDAGVYSLHAKTPLHSATEAIGFRCGFRL
jgi:formylglycine-generating enzyme required for sulfatase activity